eukprot:m.15087 g.15087  ORF g.15087 m.15087 type:complete len:90 (+) comp8575_c0_seq2:907-1176(+)
MPRAPVKIYLGVRQSTEKGPGIGLLAATSTSVMLWARSNRAYRPTLPRRRRNDQTWQSVSLSAPDVRRSEPDLIPTELVTDNLTHTSRL